MTGLTEGGSPIAGNRALAWTWLPLLLTALVRVGWLTLFPSDPIAQIDPEGFHLLAVNLLDGNGFAIGWEPPFCPTAVRTPLYPLFLAGVYTVLGRMPERAVLSQVLLEVLTTATTMALCRELLQGCRHDRLVTLTGVLYALNGTTQRFTGYLYSETLLLLLLSVALLLSLRCLRWPTAKRCMLSALAWGSVLLTKPNVQYLAIVVGLLLTVRVLAVARGHSGLLRRIRPVVIFGLTLCLILAPWLIRNRLVLGRWALSTAFEENVARVSAVATQAELLGIPVEPWTETWEAIYRDLERRAAPDPALAGKSKEDVACELRAVWQERIATDAKALVLDHLGVYVGVHIRGVLRNLFDPGHRLWYYVLTGHDWSTTGVVPDIWQRMVWSLERRALGDALAAFWSQRVVQLPPAAAGVWWSLLIARFAGLAFALRGALWVWRDRPLSALFLLAIIAYHLVLPGPIAHDRFNVPVVPAGVLLVAMGLHVGLWPAEHLRLDLSLAKPLTSR